MSLEAIQWQSDLNRFLDTDQHIEADEQLQLMADFRHEFGQNAPELGRGQEYDRLSRAVEHHPSWRIVPTMIDTFSARRQSTELREGSVFAEMLGDHTTRLVMPQDLRPPSSTIEGVSGWHKLWEGQEALRQSDGTFADGPTPPVGHDYVLLYKCPDGSMGARRRFFAKMFEAGQAVPDYDGRLWTYPLMDISGTQPDRDYKQPAALYDRLNYIISPEARLGVQLLRLVGGQPMHPDVVDVTNEALVQLADRTGGRQIRGVVGVTRSETDRHLRQSWWSMLPLPDWQLPEGVSGLEAEATVRPSLA